MGSGWRRVAVVGIAAAQMCCAQPLGVSRSGDASDAPVAPGSAGFDEGMIDRLIPGLTPKEQVRGWFGEPDSRSERGDGKSEWIYNKARLRAEDPRREARERKARERTRAADAKQLQEESLALLELGRRSLKRFAAWLDRKLFYPPSPARRRAADARERAWAQADAKKAREEPPPSKFAAADAALLADESEPVTQYDLAILFSRDGVVDEFHYQRTAGREILP